MPVISHLGIIHPTMMKNRRIFLIFHTRFPNSGENHSVRVHQMYFTEDGWPVVSPLRYSNEKIADYSDDQISGEYRLIHFDKLITDDAKAPLKINLSKDKKFPGCFWIMEVSRG